MCSYRPYLFALFLLFTTFGAPPTGESGERSDKLKVAVVNYPLKYFAERIAGDYAEVTFPIPTGVDPAVWAPEPQGVLAFQSVDVILLNGATYSKWLDKVTLPRRKLVNTSQSFKDQYIPVKNLTTHSHGPEGAHAHAGMAFTTWIDLRQAVQQAEAIRDTLVRLVPEKEKQFEENFSALRNDLLALDRRIEELVENKRGQPLVASHPVYDYFARRYRLNVRSLLWEPDEVPSSKQWAELERMLTNHRAKWMIWEGKPNATSVARLQSLGIKSLVFDPTGNVPDEGDFLSVMNENVVNLRGAFE